MREHYLERLFNPRLIAVWGASDVAGSLGHRVFCNLLSSPLAGKTIPVNARHRYVGGERSYMSLAQARESVDLAIVASPPSTYDDVFEDCRKAKAPFAVLLRPDAGEEDEGARERIELSIARARAWGLRVLGPGVLGLIVPGSGLRASPWEGPVKEGRLALVSQSSGLCAAALDWAASEGVGFSAVAAVGSGLSGIGCGEILDYLARDEKTAGVILHVDSAQNGRRLMSAMRAVADVKPLAAFKSSSGRDGEAPCDGAGPSLSYRPTQSEMYGCAFRRAGAMPLERFGQIFAAAKILAEGKAPGAGGLAIVCNGGGLGSIAADAAASLGAPLASFSPQTEACAREQLPLGAGARLRNPIDAAPDASPLRYRAMVKACLEDPNVSAVLAIYCPQGRPGDAEKTAEMVAAMQAGCDKPLLCSWIGGAGARAAKAAFAQSGALHFNLPEEAIEAFSRMRGWRLGRIRALEPCESDSPRLSASALRQAREEVDRLTGDSPTTISERQTMRLLGCFGIACGYAELATSADEAAAAAARIGFPVAMKIDSAHVARKATLGGLALNVSDEGQARAAYESIMEHAMVMAPDARVDGVSVQSMRSMLNAREIKITVGRDATFGPFLSFGPGGAGVSAPEKPAVALPPLDAPAARELMESPPLGRALGAGQGMPPVDVGALRRVLGGVCDMVAEIPEIAQMKLDVLASPQGAIVTGARAVLESVSASMRPYEHMAIAPYPRGLETPAELPGAGAVVICPIRPEDSALVQDFVTRGLGEESRRWRFMSSIRRLSPAMLSKLTRLDYDVDMGLMMLPGWQFEGRSPDGRDPGVIAIARYSLDPGAQSCEFAVAVRDRWAGRGAATLISQRLMDIARGRGVKRIWGEALTENVRMQRFARKMGFTVKRSPVDPTLTLMTKDLSDSFAEAESGSDAVSGALANIASLEERLRQRIRGGEVFGLRKEEKGEKDE